MAVGGEPTDNNSSDVIVQALPKHYRARGASFVEHLIKHGVSWNSRGELVHKNQSYPLTNVVDLVRDSLIGYKHFTPRGVDLFCKVLAQINMPLSLIINPRRRKQVIEYQKSPSSKSLSTLPTHSINKKKKRKPIRKWLHIS